MNETSDRATPRPRPALPTSVSEQARQSLANWRHMPPYPPLDDPEAWIEMISSQERDMIEILRSIRARQEAPAVAEDIDVDGVPTYVVRATDVDPGPDTPVYLDIHGGGLIQGSGEMCKAVVAMSAATTGLVHWGVDYRLPPRHPYPAPLDDCMTVYRHLLRERRPDQIFVGGGSAGGNLAAAVIVRAKDEGLPMPAGLVLISPEVDLTESGDSFQTLLGIDNVLTSSLMQANLLYANGHDLAHPYLSPLFADMSGFPPTFLQAGTRDLFLSNAVRMHRRLRAAGVAAELHVFEAMPHGGFGGAPEDLEMRGEVRRFIDRIRSLN